MKNRLFEKKNIKTFKLMYFTFYYLSNIYNHNFKNYL